MVDAHHLNGMLQMGNGIHDVCLALLAQESMIERSMSHTTTGCQGTHLIVGQVARHIAEGTAAAMATHDRSLTDFQCIIETLFACMTQIYHNAKSVHLLNHLSSKAAHTIMGITATGTITDIVIAIMTKGNIHNTTLCKVLYIAQVMLQSQTVFYTQHDALSALALIAIQVGRCTGYTEVSPILADDFLYLIEDKIGILSRSLHIKSHLAAEAFTYLRLRQISHHGSSILASIGHLMQIYENAGITMIELDALREEHRCITMRIKGKDALMQLLGSIEIISLVHKPMENLSSFLSKPFRMPLYAKYLLILVAFYRLNDSISRLGYDAHVLARLTYSLMMERINKNLFCPIYII